VIQGFIVRLKPNNKQQTKLFQYEGESKFTKFNIRGKVILEYHLMD